MADPFHITADEINCLIYAYFKDSGFHHSAFVLRAEGRLEHSQHYRKNIPRGELVELLSKALLFSEVEAHWRGDNMTLNCTNQFKLLEPHVCSYDPNFPPPPLPDGAHLHISQTPHTNIHTAPMNGIAESSLKRKTSSTSSPDELPREKRTKIATGMDVEMHSPVVVEPRPPAQSNPTGSVDERLVVASPTATRDTHVVDTTEPPDLANGAVQLLKAHKAEVFVCAWNPVDPTYLASGSKDSVVHIWNVPGSSQGETTSPTIGHPLTCAYVARSEGCDLTSITWSPDGAYVAVGCFDSVLRICDAQGKGYFTHAQHDKGPIFAVRFSPSGRWLVSASLDGSACVWEVGEKRLHRQYQWSDSEKECCLDVDWISDTIFVTSKADGLSAGHASEVNQVKCNPTRTRLASCSDDDTGRVWNIEDVGSSRATPSPVILKGHNSPISNIVWSPFTPAGEHEIVATVNGQCLCTFKDHVSVNLYALSFSPDGRYVGTAGADGWLHIYDVQARKKRWSWHAGNHRPSIFEIVWQQSGQLNRIAMAMEQCTVGVVDLTKVLELR
ncbi:WD40 repeat-like protein [Epithele typhae]|uniref:WD40 repeat-like protein n=1 Tax=Epithele typhae TaxID=378194 RepID=UPI00200833AE|nr:WD40 repeat-like protein [Epithele typhae]KAH9944279.1 WD40 repeat-like protein [Epithele typhae]